MEHGRIVYDGTAADLLAHGDVQEFYLGTGARQGRQTIAEGTPAEVLRAPRVIEAYLGRARPGRP